MRAKRFFYACGGILMLAIGYNIAAPEVQGRSPTRALPSGQASPSACGSHVFGTEDGQLYSFTWNSFPGTFVPGETIPVQAKLVALGQMDGSDCAVAANGDVFRRHDPEGWFFDNNIFIRASNAPPGDGPVVDAVWDGSSTYAITAQGNAYEGGPQHWRYLGNIFSGTVAAKGTAWTEVKNTYRGEKKEN